MNKKLDKEKRAQMIQQVIDHQVVGEAYINTPANVWKLLVLKNFKKVQSGELSVEALVKLLESQGVNFEQKPTLVYYPVEDCLKYISKLSKQTIEFNKQN